MLCIGGKMDHHFNEKERIILWRDDSFFVFWDSEPQGISIDVFRIIFVNWGKL